MSAANLAFEPISPSQEDIELAETSSRILSSYIEDQETQNIRIIEDDETITIPAVAFRLLVQILSQMAKGNAIIIIPIHAELTTQEAADFLNVSRPFLVKLLDSGQIPYRKVGTHRRVYFKDVAEYKKRIDEQRSKTLDELVAQAQELNMGYD